MTFQFDFKDVLVIQGALQMYIREREGIPGGL